MDNGSLNGFSPDKRMDNPLSTRVIAGASQDVRNNSDKNSPNKGSLHVGFTEEKGEVKEKRERFLTAKYGVCSQVPLPPTLTITVFPTGPSNVTYQKTVGS